MTAQATYRRQITVPKAGLAGVEQRQRRDFCFRKRGAGGGVSAARHALRGGRSVFLLAGAAVQPAASRCLGRLVVLWVALGSLVCCSAIAQTPWHYHPYQVQVWVALQPIPQLTQRLQDEILTTVRRMAEITDLASWRVAAEPAPARFRVAMVRDMDHLTEQLNGKSPDDPSEADKLILVAVDLTRAGYRVRVRQLDCHYRIWGPAIERTTWQLGRIPLDVFDALRQSFVPMVRLEKVKGKEVQVRVRAGGLALSDESPAWIPDAAILQPVIRRNDRLGKLGEGGVQPVAWTVLAVSQRHKARLVCTIHSAMRSPISSRASRRVEKVAFLVKRQGQSTRVVLRSNDKAERPLVGYRVYARTLTDPHSQDLGVTDWQGSLLVRLSSDGPSTRASTAVASSPVRAATVDELRLLYVKSGTRMLARLPVIPGVQPLLVANIPDDDVRLGAEGVITGLQNAFLDLVARRQVMASQIRTHIERGQFDKAKEMIEELRKVEARPEFADRLAEQELLLATDDPRVQKRIDMLFSDLRRLLTGHLDPQLPNQLAIELSNAQRQAAAKTASK